MKFYDENNNIIDHMKIERVEQKHAEMFLHKNDVVLELGARYGTVSCVINKKVLNQVSVEPDQRVWESLQKNMKINNCNFNIIKGFVSNKKLELIFDKNDDYATSSKICDESNIPSYTLNEIKKKFNINKFNVLIIDAEGFMEQFIDENIDILKDLRLIMFEADQPQKCDYNKIEKILIENNFRPKIKGFHNVYFKL
jgi:FkbM family methyltransferase